MKKINKEIEKQRFEIENSNPDWMLIELNNKFNLSIESYYHYRNIDNMGIFGTVFFSRNSINGITKIIVSVITRILLILNPQCPVYKDLLKKRTSLLIEFENGFLTTSILEILYDFVEDYINKIDFKKFNNIFIDAKNLVGLNDTFDNEQQQQLRYILEFNNLINEMLFVSKNKCDFS